MPQKDRLLSIPTGYLPHGWAKLLAIKHEVSVSRVEKIVYGLASSTTVNTAIYNDVLTLAEEGKQKAIDLKKELSNRLTALTA